MSHYRRSHFGRVYFFTVVTHERRPLFNKPAARRSLREAFREERGIRPFEMPAIVLLPDHLHAIWRLPMGDTDYSTRWRRIKSRFTQLWRAAGGMSPIVSSSRQRRSEQGFWQRRFFEHTCRDDEDVRRCMDYIHINPVKHGLVERAVDWPWSSFHRYVRLGIYAEDWGHACEFYGDEFKDVE